MASLSNRDDAERFVRAPGQNISLVLLYGPDHGLVVERGGILANAVTGENSDPMQVVRLEGDAVAADPLSLVDEANTMSMFGGKRVIRLRASNMRGGSKGLTAAIQPLIDTPPIDALVIIEAGELKNSDPLVSICSGARSAMAIACYGDSERDLGSIIGELVRQAGKTIDSDAKSLLQSLAGGDRIATRGEIDKLLLYVGENARIAVEDVIASVGDTANAVVETALDGAFAGDIPLMMTALDRLRSEGTDANTLLIRALAHGWRLAQVVELVAAKGRSGDSWKLISPIFTRKTLIERQIAQWRPDTLLRHVGVLSDAIRSARIAPRLADAVMDRAMLGIALAARRNRQ